MPTDEYTAMLSRSAAYAIRALSYISSRAEGVWVMNREIAAELELPPMFLAKLLRVLAEAGMLQSLRGRTGGFRLARAAERITLLEIVEPFDSLLHRTDCVLGQEVCSNARPCPLHDEWIASSRRMAATLRKMTLDGVADASHWRGGFPRSRPDLPTGKVVRQPRPSAPGGKRPPPRRSSS